MADGCQTLSGDAAGGKRVGRIYFALLVVFAAGCFLNTLNDGFVNWDDGKLIVNNGYIRALTWENLRHIWTRPILETYLPLRVTSYALDYAIWGGKPFGFHLTNVVLHVACSALVFFVALRLSQSGLAAACAGILFAVHPVHTEAVAWASGRKDVLSTALLLLSYLLYLQSRSAGGRRWRLVVASLVAFFLAGLAKAMVVTLPVLVVLTDAIYGEARADKTVGERKVRRREDADKNAGKRPPRWIRPCVWAAYFAVAAAAAWIAVHFASAAGAIRPYHFASGGRTALFMTWVALYYVKTMLWPNVLSARYPYGDTAEFGVDQRLVYASPVVLGVILAAVAVVLVVAARRKSSGALKLAGLGLAWFFVTLLPVMNFVSINVLVADRYLYLPSAGFLMAVGAALAAVHGDGLRPRWGPQRVGLRRVAASVVFGMAVAGFSARTLLRNEVWKDSTSLWSSVVREFPESAQARMQLASAYADASEPDYAKALEELDIAGGIDAKSGDVHLARGKVFARMGEGGKAAAEFEAARRLGVSGRAELYETNIAEAALAQAGGRFEEAAAALERAIAVDPARPEGYNNLGYLRQARGDLEEARRLYLRAVETDAKFARAWYNLGVLAAQAKDTQRAIGCYNRALGADPAYAEAMVNLAGLYLGVGDVASATRFLETAVYVAPGLIPARVNLARAYIMWGDGAAARRELEEALRLAPGNSTIKEMIKGLDKMTEGGK